MAKLAYGKIMQADMRLWPNFTNFARVGLEETRQGLDLISVVRMHAVLELCLILPLQGSELGMGSTHTLVSALRPAHCE